MNSLLSTAEILDVPDVGYNVPRRVDRVLHTDTEATDVGVGGGGGVLSHSIIHLEVIIKTLEDALRIAPPERHHNDAQLFKLNRALLTLECNTGQELSPVERKSVFLRWHRVGIDTNQLDPAKSRDEYLVMFFAKAAKAKVPIGRTLAWTALLEELNRRPLPPVDIYEGKEIRRLIVLCEILQEFWGASPFFLPCRKAGEVIGVSHSTANNYLNSLLGAKVLKLVSQGGMIKGQKVSTRYRYFPNQTMTQIIHN